MRSNVKHYRHALFLLLFMLQIQALYSQIDRSNAAFAIGYQYADFGSSLAGSEVRMMSMNASVPDGGNAFTNGRQAFGLVTRFTTPCKNDNGTGFFMEFMLANKKVLSNQAYDYYAADSSSFQPLEVFTKQRLRYFSFGAGYAWKRFSASASVDMGMFASLIRFKGAGFDNKWQPWFSHPKVFGSGVSGKTPVIGSTVSLNYLLTDFLELRVGRQFTAFGMGVDLSDHYFSLKNWSAELTFRFTPN